MLEPLYLPFRELRGGSRSSPGGVPVVKEGGISPEKEWLHSPGNWPYSVVESTLTIRRCSGMSGPAGISTFVLGLAHPVPPLHALPLAFFPVIPQSSFQVVQGLQVFPSPIVPLLLKISAAPARLLTAGGPVEVLLTSVF